MCAFILVVDILASELVNYYCYYYSSNNNDISLQLFINNVKVSASKETKTHKCDTEQGHVLSFNKWS
jgi:hypothetical protein